VSENNLKPVDSYEGDTFYSIVIRVSLQLNILLLQNQFY